MTPKPLFRATPIWNKASLAWLRRALNRQILFVQRRFRPLATHLRSAALRVDRAWLIAAVMILLTAFYAGGYLSHPFMPGNQPSAPLGWWGWADQSAYLKGAVALMRLDFRPAENWYPLGYSALGAPFVKLWPTHAWFFVDLMGLLAAFAGFIAFARRLGVGTLCAVLLFLLPLADWRIREVWEVPWNTTPEAGLMWLLLAAIAVGTTKSGLTVLRAFAVGLIATAIPAIRPTDALFSLICVVGLAGCAAAERRLRGRDIAAAAVGGALVAIPYLVLYVRIYGWHPTAYMTVAGRFGFNFRDLPFKTFVLLDDPRPWFGEGVGICQRFPWLPLGIAGALAMPWSLRGPARRAAIVLVVALAAYYALYFSYADLLPTGLWLYENIHYFAWTLPGLALLGWLLLRALWSGSGAAGRSWIGRRLIPLAALLATAILLSVRQMPVPVAGDDDARLAVFETRPLDWETGYSGNFAVSDRRGILENPFDMHTVPDGPEILAVATKRAFSGPIRWVPGRSPRGAFASVPKRFAAKLTIGWPCGLPPYPCNPSAISVFHLGSCDRGGDSGQLSPAATLVLGRTYKFFHGGDGNQFVDSGFSVSEDWGRWTDGPCAYLRLSLPRAPEKPISLTIDAISMSRLTDFRQTADVQVNGRDCGNLTISVRDKIGGVTCPVGVFHDSANLIRFHMRNPVRPVDFNFNDDDRNLGIGLKTLTLTAASAR
jgi:hypothetical protein